MNFAAEIIRTTQRKLVSNDNQYELVLRTDNPLILDFGKLPGDTVVKVEITLDNNTSDDEDKEKVAYEQI